MNRKTIAIITVIVVAASIWLFVFLNSDSDTQIPTGMPEQSESISPSPTLTPTPWPNIPTPADSGFIGPTGLRHPATCSVEGEIIFIEKNIFTSDAKISWQNVDMNARHINWHVIPNDTLDVGPNLFEILSIPHGISSITVGLPGQPKAKSYILRASVTYGEYISGDVEIRESQCAGDIPVILNF